MRFGLYGNQVSAGTIEMRWLTRAKNVCTLAAKNETQQRSAELKYINAQQKGNKKLSYAWEDHFLSVNLCVKFVMPLFSQNSKERELGSSTEVTM